MKPPKKSENLEVRLSHQDKTALQDRAAQEGRSVSAVVRGLISSYLAQPNARSNSNRMMELLMILKSKPKSVMATLAVCIALPFAFTPLATAETFSLNLEGHYSVPEKDGTRIRSAKMDVHMKPGDDIDFPFGAPADSPLNLSVSMTEEDGKLILSFKLQDGPTTFATPTLIAELDEQTKVEININDGRTFKLTALPRQIDQNTD